MPLLVDLSYVSGTGSNVVYSKNGLYKPGAAYSNNFVTANRQAFYLTNEMKMDRLRIDVGVRLETLVTDVSKEGSASYTMSADASLTTNLKTVKWG